MELVGYFYLPHRLDGSCIYNPPTKKFGKEYRNAPIMSDMIQSSGGAWGGSGAPFSSHRARNGNVPTGGNFLFEDGHVVWIRFDEVQIGATMPGWEFWYKIEIER